jgi:hypothetical protein
MPANRSKTDSAGLVEPGAELAEKLQVQTEKLERVEAGHGLVNARLTALEKIVEAEIKAEMAAVHSRIDELEKKVVSPPSAGWAASQGAALKD